MLVVDDDLRTAQRLAKMLREDGFEVEVARDGAAAIARFTRDPVPAVLVTELEIPHVGGVAVARFARSQRPGLPLFVVTVAPNLVNSDDFGSPPPLLFTKPVAYAAFRDALEVSLRPDGARRPTSDLGPVPPT